VKRNTAVLLTEDVTVRLDTLAEALSEPWFTATRSDALRAAIARGLEELERKLDVAKAADTGPPRTTGARRGRPVKNKH
jgi:predicted DNA-binding protein